MFAIHVPTWMCAVALPMSCAVASASLFTSVVKMASKPASSAALATITDVAGTPACAGDDGYSQSLDAHTGTPLPPGQGQEPDCHFRPPSLMPETRPDTGNITVRSLSRQENAIGPGGGVGKAAAQVVRRCRSGSDAQDQVPRCQASCAPANDHDPEDTRNDLWPSEGAANEYKQVGCTSSLDRRGGAGAGAVSVPAACPMRWSTEGYHGHSRTTPQVSQTG